jgi:hypothetical protein
MTDLKEEVSGLLHAHAHAIDDLHRKLAAVAGCDKQRLEKAVAKYKAAHAAFEDDAQGCVIHT